MTKRSGILPPPHILLVMILIMVWVAIYSINPITLILLLLLFYSIELIKYYPKKNQEFTDEPSEIH